jgi:hypothetical protein
MLNIARFSLENQPVSEESKPTVRARLKAP